MVDIKVIVLDRDGVINQDSPNFIKHPNDWHAIKGSLEAIAQLNKAGYKVAVATNQSGLARAYFSQSDLELIHNKMVNQLAEFGGRLDGIFICPHGPNDGCDCRKPSPGLLFKITKHFVVNPEQMLVIGDSMRDLLAAKAAGCIAVLVKTGNGEKTLNIKNNYKNVELLDGGCDSKTMQKHLKFIIRDKHNNYIGKNGINRNIFADIPYSKLLNIVFVYDDLAAVLNDLLYAK